VLTGFQCTEGFFKPCRFQSAGRGSIFSGEPRPILCLSSAADSISQSPRLLFPAITFPPAYPKRLSYDADLSRPFNGGDLAAAILSLSVTANGSSTAARKFLQSSCGYRLY
ncbi:Hypothetical predicted protein, partial [Pelobates cultripes]